MKFNIVAKVIVIDFGMTNFRVAVSKDERGKFINVIANAEGSLKTPSVVAYNENGTSYVGQIAKHRALIDPKNTIDSIKRFIGRKYDEVSQEASHVGYQIRPDINGEIKISCPNASADLTPEEIAAQILRKLADAASTYLGETVTQAVLTVPTYFNDSQRQAMKNAGTLAGLDVLRIINDASAACLAYGLLKENYQTILVFNLGGSTLDVNILEVGDGVFEVLSTHNNCYLGGDDFDQKIIDWIANEFQHREGIDLRQDSSALQQLKIAAETAKIELSHSTETFISIPFISTEGQIKHLDLTLTRTEFEQMCSDLLERCRLVIEQAIQDSSIPTAEINHVVLVGGSTHMPMVQELLQQVTGLEPKQSINPSEVVAIGATVQSSILERYIESGSYWDLPVTRLSLGIETSGGLMSKIIERCSFIPIKKSLIFSTTTDWQPSLEIKIFRGERLLAKGNTYLGSLHLNGILFAPKGVPQIEVTFEVDANKIVSVTARDLATGKEASIVLPDALSVESEELNLILRDAYSHAEEDYKLIQPIEAKEKANSIISDAYNQLIELMEKMPMADKKRIEELVKSLEDARRNTESESNTTRSYQSSQALFPVTKLVHALAGSINDAALLGGSSD